MDTRGLGLTPIGFGAFKIGRNQGIKYPSGYDLPDEQRAERLLNGVLDLGINYIDTAPAYGLSEERVGRAIAHRYHECVVSTKVGEEFEAGRSRHDFSSRGVRRSVERSLRRLRADVLDLVFVHCSRDDLRIVKETDVVPTLHALRDKGLVRRMGFSGYTDVAYRACLAWADAVMVEYHLENRALEPVIAEAAAGGVAIVVKKGLASGHLPAEDAIRFVLSHGQVSSMVIGGLDLEHMHENLRVAREVRGK
jgi:aryl-alcohol dehydrogenase-like predicted oxidoreductase